MPPYFKHSYLCVKGQMNLGDIFGKLLFPESLLLIFLFYSYFCSSYFSLSFKLKNTYNKGAMHLLILQEVLKLKEQLTLHSEMMLCFKDYN